MGPAPLLVPSIVTIGLGWMIGTVIALKRPLPSVLAAALSGVVPALITWIAVCGSRRSSPREAVR
jgi:hypothetical protein